MPIARHARSCERHGGGASSTRIEAPSQSAQDPYHLGWTPWSVLTLPGVKRTRHVFDPFYRRHMPEVPQASKALRYRGTSDEPSPCNPQLPMHRLRSCISQSHLPEAGRAVSTDGSLKSPITSPPTEADLFCAFVRVIYALQRAINVARHSASVEAQANGHTRVFLRTP